MLSLEQQFGAWVRTKPADETYNWLDIAGCALYRFFSESGYPIAHVGRETWFDHDDNGHDVPARMHEAAATKPYTYGALAKRLEQAGQS